jgi:hypothetical protein
MGTDIPPVYNCDLLEDSNGHFMTQIASLPFLIVDEPAISPDFSPIEPLCATLKKIVRRMRKRLDRCGGTRSRSVRSFGAPGESFPFRRCARRQSEMAK